MLSASSTPHQETLFVKKLSEYAQLPQRGSKGAAGYDLFRYLNTYFYSGISIHISVQVSQYIPGFHKKCIYAREKQQYWL
jgi:hypothetical protein